MRENLQKEKFEVWDKELDIQYAPDQAELKKAAEFGREFAKKCSQSM